jgi:hypothetical protein
MKMSENKDNKNYSSLNSLFRLFSIELDSARISGWLREMDGENSEEDRAVHSHHSKLDSENSNPSVKKIP